MKMCSSFDCSFLGCAPPPSIASMWTILERKQPYIRVGSYISAVPRSDFWCTNPYELLYSLVFNEQSKPKHVCYAWTNIEVLFVLSYTLINTFQYCIHKRLLMLISLMYAYSYTNYSGRYWCTAQAFYVTQGGSCYTVNTVHLPSHLNVLMINIFFKSRKYKRAKSFYFHSSQFLHRNNCSVLSLCCIFEQTSCPDPGLKLPLALIKIMKVQQALKTGCWSAKSVGAYENPLDSSLIRRWA